jgi:23S rRNA (uracil1939-C5)-methyltransferase
MSGLVRITAIAAGGDGVGRLGDGRAVFVPRAAPGDLVELAEVRLHARFARARIDRLVEEGEGRVAPRCPHYEGDQCGGCQLQHLDLPAQERARRGIVGDALRRIAKLDLPDPELSPSVEAWGYRTKITLAVDGTGRRAGFHRVDDATGVFDLTRCQIAAGDLNDAWEAVREARAAWPPALDQVVLRRDREGVVHVLLRGEVRPAAEPAATLVHGGDPVALWWQPPVGAPRRLAGRAPDGTPPPTYFEQVNPAMGDRVRARAIEALGPVDGRLVWDLYAGAGESTARLLALGGEVESVEADGVAVDYAERMGPGAGAKRHAGTVEEWLPRLRRPAKVLLNPPRTGLGKTVVAGLRRARPETIVYISCDPATLARDLARLGASWRVAEVQAFDLFPQTAHVETVVRLEAA